MKPLQIEPFATEHLTIESWKSAVDDNVARHALTVELAAILTPPVLAQLPPSLQLGDNDTAISSWIDARDAESLVLAIRSKDDHRLIGLLILAPVIAADARTDLHIGYLLAEAEWGRGFGTEVVSGLVTAMRHVKRVRLVGGVDPENLGSVRVLQKAGFHRDPVQSGPKGDLYVCDIDAKRRRNAAT